MPPHPTPRKTPESGPRHAVESVQRAHTSQAFTATTGGLPPVRALGATGSGRHRRPESLADARALRLPLVARNAAARNAPVPAPRPDAAPQPTSPAPRRADAGPSRGRHAKPTDQLSITVRPLPAVRDAAEAVRDWAFADSGRAPVTGSHRAPGTLPIESWLLIGRRRQQALLATLVAVGLMLVVVPIQQRGGPDANPVNAADQATVTGKTKAPKKQGKPAGRAAAPGQADSPAAPGVSVPPHPVAVRPTPTRPGSQASAPAPAPPIPAGDGPANSLIRTGTKVVALTFDDGPDPEQTPKILELLAKYQVKATFCLVGDQVRRHPDIVRQIAAAGHTLCNHTWEHSLTIGKDKPAKIRADLRRTNDAIRAAVPDAKIPFFRAPGGNFSDRLVRVAYADGMTSLYWEVDPRDWEHTANEDDAAHINKVVKGVQQHVRAGSIVLSHDFNQPDTIKAYEELLPWLTERFELGLMPEPERPAAPATVESPPASAAPADPEPPASAAL
jgi:peptidoglycan/xylan/chitin deacetylase (PgdA/CDA1 family)